MTRCSEASIVHYCEVGRKLCFGHCDPGHLPAPFWSVPCDRPGFDRAIFVMPDGSSLEFPVCGPHLSAMQQVLLVPIDVVVPDDPPVLAGRR